jgi:hypothetical protein
MSVLERIAYFQGRRVEVPNQELARDLAERGDLAGIREIAEALWRPEPNVRSDCLKVLYEIGYLRPELIAPYAVDFLRLLGSRNNRLVWGAMIALSTVAEITADQLYPHVAEMQRAMERGTIITIDAGVLALSRIASTSDDRRTALLPYLLDLLRSCRPSDVPRHAERILMAVTTSSKEEFCAVLQRRMKLMTPAQAARLNKVIRQAEAR